MGPEGTAFLSLNPVNELHVCSLIQLGTSLLQDKEL
jgi:hypothetical protein